MTKNVSLIEVPFSQNMYNCLALLGMHYPIGDRLDVGTHGIEHAYRSGPFPFGGCIYALCELLQHNS